MNIETKAPPRFGRHKEICTQLTSIYKQKNSDYGNSFGEMFAELGIITAITRIGDKYNRIKNLAKSGQQHVKDEAITDTLLDMAGYSILAFRYLKEHKDENYRG